MSKHSACCRQLPHASGRPLQLLLCVPRRLAGALEQQCCGRCSWWLAVRLPQRRLSLPCDPAAGVCFTIAARRRGRGSATAAPS